MSGYPWDADIATLPIAGSYMTEVRGTAHLNFTAPSDGCSSDHLWIDKSLIVGRSPESGLPGSQS